MRSQHFLRTFLLAGITLAAAAQPASAAEPDRNPDGRDTLLPLSSLTGDKSLNALMARLEVRLGNTLVWSGKIRPDQQDDLMFGALRRQRTPPTHWRGPARPGERKRRRCRR